MDVIYPFDLFGTFAFAMSGGLVAARNRMDLFGVLFMAFVTAVGGGTLRDILIDRHPVFWMRDMNYLMMVTGSGLLTFFLAGPILKLQYAVRIADAIGLGAFTIIGMKAVLVSELPAMLQSTFIPPIAVMMGTTTGIMGGVLRDVFAARTPLIFSEEIYATACICGGIFFFLLTWLGVGQEISLILSGLFIIVVRIMAIIFKWSLPKSPKVMLV